MGEAEAVPAQLYFGSTTARRHQKCASHGVSSANGSVRCQPGAARARAAQRFGDSRAVTAATPRLGKRKRCAKRFWNSLCVLYSATRAHR